MGGLPARAPPGASDAIAVALCEEEEEEGGLNLHPAGALAGVVGVGEGGGGGGGQQDTRPQSHTSSAASGWSKAILWAHGWLCATGHLDGSLVVYLGRRRERRTAAPPVHGVAV
jgi:hypothetical protein